MVDLEEFREIKHLKKKNHHLQGGYTANRGNSEFSYYC